jgi:hypothetical protein
LWVDYPLAFVAMPFQADWSDDVYLRMIKPAVEGAGLECQRADAKVMVGDIREGLWKHILHAGIIVADISIENANVYYELGLAHALGKDTILLKRKDTDVPADFEGLLNYAYDIDDLDGWRVKLELELKKWAASARSQEVKKLSFINTAPG